MKRFNSLKFFLENQIKMEGLNSSPRKTVLEFIDSLPQKEIKELSAVDYYLLENENLDATLFSKIVELKGSCSYNSLLISLIIGDVEIFKKIYENLNSIDKENLFNLASATNNKNIFNFLVDKNPDLNNVRIFNKFINKEEESPFLNNLEYDKQTILDDTNFFINPKYNFLQAKNLNEAIKLIYPKSGKKLFKMLMPRVFKGKLIDWSYLHFAHYCSVYFEDYNDFQEILQEIEDISFYKELIPIHFILENFPRKTLKNIILNTCKDSNYDLTSLVRDFKNQYEQLLKICENDYVIDHKKINSIKDLHDIITRDFSLATRHGANFYLGLEFKYPFLRNLKQKTFNGLNIVIPKDNYTLVEWGQKMNNCIGSYSNSVKSGESIVFALYEGNEVKYNIEIEVKDKSVRQFVSYGNHVVPKNIQEEMAKLISQTLNESLEKEIEVDEEAKSYRKLFELNNTPIDIKQNELNKIFLINQTPCENSSSGLSIHEEFSIVKGGLVSLLSDKLTNNKLLKVIGEKEQVSFLGLKKQANQMGLKSFKKINLEKFNQDFFDVLKDGCKFIVFDVKSFYKQSEADSFPQKLQENDLSALYEKLREFKDITFIEYHSDVKKAKEIKYFGKSVSERYADQIIFTSKTRVIDPEMRLNIIKNTLGKENFFIKMKN